MYFDLIASIGILRLAQTNAYKDTGSAFDNPAWSMLQHAINYLSAQADATMRGQ